MESHQKNCENIPLGELNYQLGMQGFTPTIDIEESTLMPGKNKGVAGYIMLNDKLKTMLDGLCDLNRWNP